MEDDGKQEEVRKERESEEEGGGRVKLRPRKPSSKTRQGHDVFAQITPAGDCFLYFILSASLPLSSPPYPSLRITVSPCSLPNPHITSLSLSLSYLTSLYPVLRHITPLFLCPYPRLIPYPLRCPLPRPLLPLYSSSFSSHFLYPVSTYSSHQKILPFSLFPFSSTLFFPSSKLSPLPHPHTTLIFRHVNFLVFMSSSFTFYSPLLIPFSLSRGLPISIPSLSQFYSPSSLVFFPILVPRPCPSSISASFIPSHH